MENNKDKGSKKELNDNEKMISYLKQTEQKKEKKIAKDLVKLKHVEIEKQKVSPEAMELANALKHQQLEHDQFEELSSNEITILESFMGKRLFLSRVAIVANQSRIPLGLEPFKKDDLEKILNSLISKGYVISEVIGGERVYFLTEKGKYRVQ